MKRLLALSIVLLAAATAVAQPGPASAPSPTTAPVKPMMPPHPMPPGIGAMSPGAGIMPPHPMPSGGATIAIQAVQGTKDGPAVGADTAILELLDGHGHVIQTIRTKLDEHGVAMVGNLPLAAPFRPRVTIEHAGGAYQADGEIIDANRPSQRITVTVYETIDQPTNWTVPMWHVMVHPAADGLHVKEMLAVQNPGDRAYLGAANPDGERISLKLNLPAGADKVTTGGTLLKGYVKVVDGKVVSLAPLAPGMNQMRLEYRVSATAGSATLTLTAPAPVRQLMVFVPQEFSQAVPEGLTVTEVYNVQGSPMQGFVAGGLQAGQAVSLTVGGFQPPVPKLSMPKILAAGGLAIMLILCVVILLRKSSRKAEPELA